MSVKESIIKNSVSGSKTYFKNEIGEKANILLLDGVNYSRMHVDRYFKENNIKNNSN